MWRLLWLLCHNYLWVFTGITTRWQRVRIVKHLHYFIVGFCPDLYRDELSSAYDTVTYSTSPLDDGLSPGTEASYTCNSDDGYYDGGDGTLTCDSSGRWDGGCFNGKEITHI